MSEGERKGAQGEKKGAQGEKKGAQGEFKQRLLQTPSLLTEAFSLKSKPMASKFSHTIECGAIYYVIMLTGMSWHPGEVAVQRHSTSSLE